MGSGRLKGAAWPPNGGKNNGKAFIGTLITGRVIRVAVLIHVVGGRLIGF